MSASAPAHAVQPPVYAPAAPAVAIAHSEPERAPQRLTTSLSAVPAVQRKCTACSDKDEMPVQPRLKVGPVNDPHEREADDIAGRVMAMRQPDAATPTAPLVQRACSSCSGGDDNDTVRRKSSSKPAGPKCRVKDDEDGVRRQAAPSMGGQETVGASASQLTSGGNALAPETRDYFESRMGRDLSDVRVHQGSASDALNTSISAHAFTYQNHIWLSQAEQAGPSFTMAHELAHVMQQTAPAPLGGEVYARRRDGPIVRRNYWQEIDAPMGGVVTKRHECLHDNFQDALKATNAKLWTEVPIPGATATNRFETACGYADLFTSTKGTVPGIEVDQKGPPTTFRNLKYGQNCGSDGWFWRMTQADSATHQANAFPRMNAAGTGFDECDKTPKNVRIGDVKPGHNEGARSKGTGQVNRYIRGLNDTAALMNALVPGCNSPGAKVMPASHLRIPDGHKANRSGGWDLPQLEFRRNRLGKTGILQPFGKGKEATATEKVRGRISGAADRQNKGIWVYFVEPHPQDLKRSLGDPGADPGYKVITADMKAIIDCLKSSPKKSATVCRRPVDPRGQVPTGTAPGRGTPHPLVRRAPRKKVRTKVKDHFNLAKWNQMRTGKVGAPPSAGNLKGQVDKQFTQQQQANAAYQNAIVSAESDFAENFGNTTFDVPKAAKAKKGSVRTKSTILEKAAFWTSRSAGFFGTLRAKMGGMFGKASELYAKFQEKGRKAFKKRKFAGGRTGQIAQAAKIAGGMVLKVLGSLMLPRIGSAVLDCLETGMERFTKTLFGGETIDLLQQKAEAAQTQAKEMKDDVFGDLTAMADSVVVPLKEKIKDITTALSVIGKIVRAANAFVTAARLGICVSGATAAGVGIVATCGLIAADLTLKVFNVSPIDWLAGRLMKSCDGQKAIAAALLSSRKVASLPDKIAVEIIDRLRDVLPDGMKGILCKKSEIKTPPISLDEYDCPQGTKEGEEHYSEVAGTADAAAAKQAAGKPKIKPEKDVPAEPATGTSGAGDPKPEDAATKDSGNFMRPVDENTTTTTTVRTLKVVFPANGDTFHLGKYDKDATSSRKAVTMFVRDSAGVDYGPHIVTIIVEEVVALPDGHFKVLYQPASSNELHAPNPTGNGTLFIVIKPSKPKAPATVAEPQSAILVRLK